MDHGKIFFEWNSPEYEFSRKNPDWFWGVGIGGLCIIITAIIWNNYLFAIFILLSVFVIFIFNTKKPRIINKKVTEHGIVLDRMFFPWKNIKRFCITREKSPRLIIETTGFMHPQIFININKEGLDKEEISTFLKKHIAEEEIELSFLKQLAEKI